MRSEVAMLMPSLTRPRMKISEGIKIKRNGNDFIIRRGQDCCLFTRGDGNDME